MTIGAMLEQWLTKLEWFSTLFPRIPVPVQKKLEEKLRDRRQRQIMEEKESRDSRYDYQDDRSDPGDRHSRDRKR